MAAQSPHAGEYNSNGGGPQPFVPPSSLGTAAVNRNSYYDLHSLSPSAQSIGSPFVPDPSASSSEPQQYSYYAHPSSSADTQFQNHLYQQQQPTPDSYEQTQYNTLANSNHLDPRTTTRPTGKFTEEWDASQRGSSIIDSPLPRHMQNHGNNNNMSSIQRSNSFSGSTSGRGGDTDGASIIQVSRSNTLKKKSSLRRNGSLGRSSSRRSTKAGSVRSLALQSNVDEDETHSAFYCPVPTTGNPTEALANRFQCEFVPQSICTRAVLSEACPAQGCLARS